MDLKILAKYLIIIVLIGVFSGIFSGIFLIVLDWITEIRIQNHTIVLALPFAGLCIGFLYYKYGNIVEKGNNLIFETQENPKTIIPFKLAPIVLFSTWTTHLFGGSAGREGTAVQMSLAISQVFKTVFKSTIQDNLLFIILAISAGFSGVFGTPWAASIFALELLIFKNSNFKYFIASVMVAFIAHYTCLFIGATHTIFPKIEVPVFETKIIGYLMILGLIFGVTSWLYCSCIEIWTKIFLTIKKPYLKPFLGGFLLALLFYFLPLQQYAGLGIATILNAFETQQTFDIFVLKIIFTSFTLSIGFKGGDVTPLFFIGATLGSALFIWFDLPLSFLVALGFVAVFAAATQSPFASTVLGIELFGWEMTLYFLIICVFSFLFSGSKRIYSQQKVINSIKFFYNKCRNRL